MEYRGSVPRRRKHRRVRIWHFIIIFAILLILVYPFLEAAQLTVEEKELKISNLPGNLKNVEIIFASDFHHSGRMKGSRTEEVVTCINNLTADLVILGGDYANNTQEAIRFFEELPAVWARMGVYAVLGDAEYSQPELVSQLIGVMVGRGIIPLVNQVEKVKVGQSAILIAGADDDIKSYARIDKLAAEVREEDFVILVSHSPDVISAMQTATGSDGSNHWYDLALFGHTHGGQVNLFGFTPFSQLRMMKANSRYFQGWLEESRAYLLTSNGIGTIGFPIRFRSIPQVHFMTLKLR